MYPTKLLVDPLPELLAGDLPLVPRSCQRILLLSRRFGVRIVAACRGVRLFVCLAVGVFSFLAIGAFNLFLRCSGEQPADARGSSPRERLEVSLVLTLVRAVEGQPLESGDPTAGRLPLLVA